MHKLKTTMSEKPLTLTIAKLQEPKDLRGLFELEEFKGNFVSNRVKTTGATDSQAAMVWEREKVLFMKAVEANKKLAECERFSLYTAFIELGVAGDVSLNDGEAYIIPYGKKAQFQVGYKGRINQMNHLPGVEHVGLPQIVWDCDEFQIEYGEEPRIIKHVPTIPRPAGAKRLAVYMVINMEPTSASRNVRKVFVMLEDEVHQIRDTYSKSYKEYVAKCRETNTPVGQPITLQGQWGPYTLEVPMWVANPDESWRKTIVKRAYKWIPKTQRLKALDAKIASNYDPEDDTGGDDIIDYGIGQADGSFQTVTKEEQPKRKATKVKADTTPTPSAPMGAADLIDIENANTTTQSSAIEDAHIEEEIPSNNPLQSF